MKTLLDKALALVPTGVKHVMPVQFRHKLNILFGRPIAPEQDSLHVDGPPDPAPRPEPPAPNPGLPLPAEPLPAARPDYLGKEYVGLEAYENKWRELFGHRLENYFAMHRRRYYELFNTFAYYYRRMDRHASVLEVGVSEFLLGFRHFFPDIRLVTVDRPAEYSGFESSWCIEKAGAERHYQIDMNVTDLAPSYGTPPLGQFDYVVCTEVIEHLTVNPVEFLTSLLSVLAPSGTLYLSTPNFFRKENLEKMAIRVNPQMVFPNRGGNADAHHHFREFEMQELLGFVADAGGQTIVHYFSDCWDACDAASPESRIPLEQRSNLVLIIQRGDRPR